MRVKKTSKSKKLFFVTICFLADFAVFIGPVVAQNTAPVTSNASYAISPDNNQVISLQAADDDGDPLSYIITSLPSKGSVSSGSTTLASGDLPYTIPDNGNSVTFTAGVDDHGTVTFQFKANDGTDDSNTATISILINQAPTEISTISITEPNTDLQLDLPAEDPDGDSMTFTISSLPGHGTIKSGSTILTDNDIPFETSSDAVTYSPDEDFHGQDNFDFTASDGNAASGTITVTIEVNTTPVPDSINTTVLPNNSKMIVLTSTDADKDPVNYIIASLPANGTLSINGTLLKESDLPFIMGTDITDVLYDVDNDYLGTDTFHYRVQDLVSQSDRAVVKIVVNNPPLSHNATVTFAEDTTAQGILKPTDADGDPLSIRITTLPGKGTLKVDGKIVSKTETSYSVSDTGLNFTYTMDSDAVGQDSFEWVVNDGLEDSISSTVTLDRQTADPTPTPSPTPEPSPDSSSDENTDSDEDILSDAPATDVAPPDCSPIGAAEGLIMLAFCMIMTPRRIFSKKYPTSN